MDKFNKTRFWLVVLFAAQFALFYQYADREIVWAYPKDFDQACYLLDTYTLSRNVQHNGFFEAVWHFIRTNKDSHGPMLYLQGMLFQLLFGVGRMSALYLNFFYFLLLEIALFAAASWLAKRESVGWLALGLLMLCNSAFFYAGGFFDFRIDLIASCLYGTFLCLLVRSDGFQERRWLVAAGACGVLMVGFRSITFFYLTGMFMLLLVWLPAAAYLEKKRGRNETAGRITIAAKNLLALFLSWLALSASIILLNWRAIHDYYVVGTITGAEKHVRAAEYGIVGLSGHLTYYINSLATDHLGWTYLIVLAVLALLVAGSWLVCSWAKKSRSLMPENLLWIALPAVAAATFSPWLILTVVESKSPVVISVLDVPVTLLIIILVAGRCLVNESEKSNVWISRACSFVAAGAMLLGAGNWIEFLTQEGSFTADRDSAEQINSFYDYLEGQVGKYSVDTPMFSTDCLSDWLACWTITDRIYESTGRWFSIGQLMPMTIFTMSREEVFHDLEKSDFVILTDYPKEGVDPIWESMRVLEPDMRAWCEKNLIRGRDFSIYDGTITVYIRPKVHIEGLTEDGWILPEGVHFHLNDSLLAWMRATSKSKIIIEGPDWFPKDPAPVVAMEMMRPDHSLKNAEASPPVFLRNAGAKYQVVLDLKKVLSDPDAQNGADIDLKFEGSFFVPKDHQSSTDTRQLVARKPETVSFE